ncbi:MAG: efflux RND transporter periplasmic adaptor subunit [Chthoniobacter sp.]|uniref:efflux RND transporter periplasmic adaptor subunit n=1 Tax=Chthoniobacter sp. TaxID=2510640 RepID=UPI0032A61087
MTAVPPSKTQARKRRRRNRWIIGGIVAVVIAVGVWFQYFRKTEELVAVETAKVGRRDLTEIVLANGRIQPVTQVTINPEVAGEIIELPVKEGQQVKKGDLILHIKPDNYLAQKNSAEATHMSALANHEQAQAELDKAEADFKRNEELFKRKLIAENVFADFNTALALARLRLQNSNHLANQAQFALDQATADLTKTTIVAPMDGTVTRLKSQLGERVLGTSFNMGTEILTIARLDEMEARVDIGEIDIVLIKEDQPVRLEVDSFKNRKFKGTVSAIANASKSSSQTQGSTSSSGQQEAPKFEVKIRVLDKEAFRPGMSVSAEIETRSRQNVLVVPIQSVTTRLPKAGATPAKTDGKPAAPIKPIEVVFVRDGDKVKMVPVKTGISDSDYFEIVEGLSEGQEIVTGGYKAISKDLEDGKKVKFGGDAKKGK